VLAVTARHIQLQQCVRQAQCMGSCASDPEGSWDPSAASLQQEAWAAACMAGA
jgi:hypothetical protein